MRIRAIALSIGLFTSQFLNAQVPEANLPPDPEAPQIEMEAPVPTPAGGVQDLTPEGAGNPREQVEATAVRPGLSRGVATTTDATTPFKVLSAANLPLFYVGDNGRVGVGTTAPEDALDIIRSSGPSRIQLGSSDTSSFSSILFSENGTDKAHISSINSAGAASPAGGVNALQLWNYTNAPIVFGTNQSERMRILGNGNVSIGTTGNSGATLQVNSIAPSGYGLFVGSTDTITADVAQNDYGLYVSAGANIAAGFRNSGVLYGSRSMAHASGEGSILATYGMRTEAGVLGGSTASVDTAIGHWVQVNSGAGAVTVGYGVYIPNVSATTDYAFYQAAFDDTNYFAGNVAIGANSSSGKLYISDTAQLPRIVLGGAEYYQPTNTATSGIGLYLGMNRASNRQLWIGDTGSTTAPFLRINPSGTSPVIEAISRDGVTAATLTVGTNGHTAMAMGNGNVGIGTASPTYKLHVIGNAHFQGTVTGTNIRATYQDVAEWVPATTDLEPGTVVVLNKTRNNEVMASHGPYDTRVAGVVSSQPGISLGIEGEGKEQIATYGRVMVKVDATKGPIEVGDLLVTSALSGTAMRSEPMDINGRSFHQPGTIIGKALEPLSGGVGEILVLLSLQ
jgi:hypothetical protein